VEDRGAADPPAAASLPTLEKPQELSAVSSATRQRVVPWLREWRLSRPADVAVSTSSPDTARSQTAPPPGSSIVDGVASETDQTIACPS